MQQAAPKSQADSREPFRPAGFEPLYSHISLLQRAGAQLSTKGDRLQVQTPKGVNFQLYWKPHNLAPDGGYIMAQLSMTRPAERLVFTAAEAIGWLNTVLKQEPEEAFATPSLAEQALDLLNQLEDDLATAKVLPRAEQDEALEQLSQDFATLRTTLQQLKKGESR